jgi:hypothetical protein
VEVPDRPNPRQRLRGAATSGAAVVIAFVLAHAFVLVMANVNYGGIYGDVSLYHWWAQRGLTTGAWPVLTEPWVYPAAALIPVALPVLFGGGWPAYVVVWCVQVIALNAVAIALLVRSGRSGRTAALWWLAFLAALGPIWLGRLDGVAAPLILMALLAARRHPAGAAALATFGAWVKIAPAAVVVALAATTRTAGAFLRRVVVPGAIASAAVIGLALAGGAGARAWGVFGEQSSRTLQAESVAATWFSVARLWDPSIRIERNDEIYTFEVQGAAARTVASMLDVLLPVAVVAIGLLAWWAARRGSDRGVPSRALPDRTDGSADRSADILVLAAFATLLALIVFNKVGSPQFVAWLGPAVAAGLAFASPGLRRRLVGPAIALIPVGALTHEIYPPGYGAFINGEVWMITVVGVRNIALVGLLAWAVRQLVARQAAGKLPKNTGLTTP